MADRTKFNGLVALLSNSIDYAGIFPPAELPLEEAFALAAGFRRRATHPWLLAKSVLPLSDILGTTPQQQFQLGSDGALVLFAALACGPKPKRAIEEVISEDLAAIQAFNDQFQVGPMPMKITCVESKLILDALKNPAQAIDALDRVFALIQKSKVAREISWFFEVQTEGLERGVLNSVAAEIAADSGLLNVGLKVRTGGQRVPDVDELSTFIDVCRSQSLKLKATQGLHHPFTHGSQFGFINLMTAVTLAYAEGAAFDSAKIADCLGETDKKQFSFSSTSMSWKGHSLSLKAIESARLQHQLCFGSCSLDEPDEYLTELVTVQD